MTIGPNVKVKGDMKFEGLLKIEGTVEGQIAAPNEVMLFYTLLQYIICMLFSLIWYWHLLVLLMVILLDYMKYLLMVKLMEIFVWNILL